MQFRSSNDFRRESLNREVKLEFIFVIGIDMADLSLDLVGRCAHHVLYGLVLSALVLGLDMPFRRASIVLAVL